MYAHAFPSKKPGMHAQRVERVNMLELRNAFLLSEDIYIIPHAFGGEWARKSISTGAPKYC